MAAIGAVTTPGKCRVRGRSVGPLGAWPTSTARACQSQALTWARPMHVIAPGHGECSLSLPRPMPPSPDKGFGKREQGRPSSAASTFPLQGPVS